MKDSNSYLIRPVKDQDISQISEVFSRAFGWKLENKYYRWRFYDSDNSEYLSYVAEIDGQIISHAGYSRALWLMDGEYSHIASKFTSFTHPEYQRNGIYSKVINTAHKEFLNKGIKWVLSWPNNKNHPSQRNRTDFIDIYQIPCLRWHSKHASHDHQLKLADKPITSFKMEDWDSIANETRSDVLFSNNCSAKYMEWRFQEHPVEKYYAIEERQGGKVIEAIIYKLYPVRRPICINVLEWLASPTLNKSICLDKLEKISSIKNLPINLWHNIHDYPRHHILERRGYTMSEPIFFFGVFHLPAIDPQQSIYNWKNWYISMGDVDVF